jgi:hypothetical protein
MLWREKMTHDYHFRFAYLGVLLMIGAVTVPAQSQSILGKWWCRVPTPMGTEYQVVIFSGDGGISVNTEIPGVSRGQVFGRWIQQGGGIYISVNGEVCNAYGCRPVSSNYPLVASFGKDGAIMWTNYGTCVSPWATFEQLTSNHHPHSKMRIMDDVRSGAAGEENLAESAARWFRKWGGMLERGRR